MSAKKLNEMSIVESARALRARDCTVRELWDACYRIAQEKNPELNAYLEIFEADENAINEAQKRIDAEGDDAPLLCGIPIAIKDNMLLEGKIASSASKMLENYTATYDATVIKKLKKAGALFVGRTNMDEFAMGSSTEHSAFGPTKNPIDTKRVPGGSSGGSATVVSADMAIASLASDTGGSIRQPAALTGIVGMKPTYGAVSRSGLIALGSSLDQIGPLAKTVEDAEILYETIRGQDPLDATTIPDSLYPPRATHTKMRIGIPRHLLTEAIEPDVRKLFDDALLLLEKDGHTLIDIELPTSPHALSAYYVIQPAEVSANLARLDGIRYGHFSAGDTLLDDYLQSRTEGFGEETRRRILLGTFVLSSGYIDAYYNKAVKACALLREEYENAFEKVDIVCFPTTTAPAFLFGEKKDSVSMYLEDIFTATANLTGMPALSLPMGSVECDQTMLPVGFHITAPHQAETLLFNFAKIVEKIIKK